MPAPNQNPNPEPLPGADLSDEDLEAIVNPTPEGGGDSPNPNPNPDPTPPNPNPAPNPNPNPNPNPAPNPDPRNQENNVGFWRRKHKEQEDAYAALKQELDGLKAGKETEVTTLSERLKSIEEERNQAIHYRDLYAVESSPIFKEKWDVPRDALKQEVRNWLRDYGADENLADTIVSTGNRRELSTLLGKHFGDMSAEQHVTSLVMQHQRLSSQREEALKKPAEVRAQLMDADARAQAALMEERKQTTTRAKSLGWDMAFKHVTSPHDPQALKLVDIMDIPGDAEHNTKIAGPLRANAQATYETVVDALGKRGVILDEAAAGMLSELTLKAAVGMHAYRGRDALWNRVQELTRELATLRNQGRPGPRPGPGSGGGGGGNGGGNYTTDGALNEVLEEVLTTVPGA